MLFENQLLLLKNAHLQNRLSHAYLLSGIAGLGKTNFARKFASFLLNTQQPENHPDYLFIAPNEAGHSIKIDQIRVLSDLLSRTSHQGDYRVVIIAPADAMPSAAANALLKTLEEPCGKIVFLLVDDQVHPLPATILSRCQKIFFYPDDKALLDSGNEKLALEIFQHLQKIVLSRANPLDPIAQWCKMDLLLVLNTFMRVLIAVARAYYDDHSAYKNLNEKMSSEKLHELLQLVCEKKRLVSQGINLNAQLCLEDLFIRASQFAL